MKSMKELFEALENINFVKKRFFIEIEGDKIIYFFCGTQIDLEKNEKYIEVSLEDYKKIINYTVENLVYQKGKVLRKPNSPIELNYAELAKTEANGYNLLDNDPFYPTEYREKGDDLYIWKTRLE